MSIKLFEDNHLTPAEGEVAVKTYHCTALDPIFTWFGVKIDGYVTVTNKRLVYFASGSSGYGATGNSRSCVEVWLPDACNITQAIGTRFSILRLVLAGVISFALGALTNLGLFAIWTAMFTSGAASLANVRLMLFLQVALATFCTVRALFTPHDRIARLAFSAVSLGALFNLKAVLLFSAVVDLPPVYSWSTWIIGAALAAQFLWSLYWFVRRRYFHIKVVGKNANMVNPPINISADSFWSRINVSSSLARHMAPAVNAGIMFKELGAIIADIQTLGDHGIKKWADTTAKAPSEEAVKAPALLPKKSVLRYASAFIAVTAVFITAEGGLTAYQRAVAEARAEASGLELQVRAIKPRDGAQWAPNLITKAEQQETAGHNAFNREKYKDASVFWNQALADYKVAGEAVQTLQAAHRDEMIYKESLRAVIKSALGKYVAASSIDPVTLAELSSFMERNAANEWAQLKDLAGKAESLKQAEKGTESQTQWQAARKLLEAVRGKIEADKNSPTKR